MSHQNGIACRDVDGHGSHTAATAAGNYGAQPPFTPRGALLSGMAPRARLAIYKVSTFCFKWSVKDVRHLHAQAPQHTALAVLLAGWQLYFLQT
jgi:hypothetical protein